MGKEVPYRSLLCFTSVFLCFLSQSSSTSSPTIVSKDQITCTMCDTCENPCHPPTPPPPPPKSQCPPPPPPVEPEGSPPPAPSSSGIYYFSPPPPTFTYPSPPPPPTTGESSGGCVGYCIPTPSPPNSFVPYFPNYYYYSPPLPSNAHATTLMINSVVSSFLILLLFILN